MFKINRSILIVCILSLFLLISQVSAIDTNHMEIDESNSIDKSIDIFHDPTDKSIEESIDDSIDDSTEFKDTNTNEKSLDTNVDKYIKNKNSSKEDKEISLNYDKGKEISSEEKPKDSSKIVTIKEKIRDTSGIVMANDDFSCGPASIATVLNKFGVDVTLNEVSKQANTSLDGTTMQSLIDTVKYYNLSAVGIELDTEKLKENYIVHLNIDGNKHWTVIRKVTDTHVFLADSTEGNINFTIGEFNSYFTKNTIILSKNSQIDLNNEMIQNQIKILDKNQASIISGKGMKRRVIGYRIVWKYGWIRKYGWTLKPRVVGGHVSFSQWQYVKGYYNVWGRYKVTEPIYKYYFVSNEALTSAKIKKTRR